jgi:hypothetical protein
VTERIIHVLTPPHVERKQTGLALIQLAQTGSPPFSRAIVNQIKFNDSYTLQIFFFQNHKKQRADGLGLDFWDEMVRLGLDFGINGRAWAW